MPIDTPFAAHGNEPVHDCVHQSGWKADRIYKAAPAAGGSRREGGSILGGLGDLLDEDSQ